MTFERISDDVWYKKYSPVANPTGTGFIYGEDSILFENTGKDLEVVRAAYEKNPLCVWTLVEGEDDDEDNLDDEEAAPVYNDVITPGMHFVNVIGYMITEKPCENENMEVYLD